MRAEIVHQDDKKAISSVTDFLTSENSSFIPSRKSIEAQIASMHEPGVHIFSYHYENDIAGVIAFDRWRRFVPDGEVYYRIGAFNKSVPVPHHYCLYQAIEHYRSTNNYSKVYLLLGTPTHRPPEQKKLHDIDFFKRGYCSDMFVREYKTIEAGPGFRNSLMAGRAEQ